MIEDLIPAGFEVAPWFWCLIPIHFAGLVIYLAAEYRLRSLVLIPLYACPLILGSLGYH